MNKPILISLCAAILFAAQATLAEGRNDPFMKCAFDDESTIALSEASDFTSWTEGPLILVATHIARAAGMPLISILVQPPSGGASLLTVYAPAQNTGSFATNPRVLIRTYVRDHRVDAVETQGRCEAYFG